MRTNRDGQRRFFVNVTKFAILLMCFATVFAIVLTAGVFDTGFDSGANVAEAETSWGSGASPATGSSLSLGGDSSYSAANGTASAADLNRFHSFIHNSSNSSTRSFSFTLDFNSTVFGSGSVLSLIHI